MVCAAHMANESEVIMFPPYMIAQWRKYLACPGVISVALDRTFLTKSDALFRVMWLAIQNKWLTDF